MKIAFLFKRDSHFKAVKATALRVCAQYKCEPTFIGIDSDYVADVQLSTVIYTNQKELNLLSDYDYVIACLGGYLLNKVIASLRATNTKVISIFPGIVSHYQLDAFISRLNADQVWLNSKADFELYNKVCRLFNHSNNGVLYGMSWLDLNCCVEKKTDSSKCEQAIFFEQTELLPKSSSKQRFINVLDKIVLENPKIQFKYKIRNNTKDEYFLSLRDHVNQFKNVDVVYELSEVEVLLANYFLSISSSALIEGIIYGKCSYIVDTTLLDFDSKEFYKGSNIELKDVILSKNFLNVNKKWYNNRISLPIRNVDLLSIYKYQSFISINSRAFKNIRLSIFKLSFFYPKLARLLFKKSKLMAIQKSLEYLSN